MGSEERLGALDAAFVALESRNTPFVVAAVLVLERQPLARRDGRLDLDRILQHIGGAIDGLPRYRQRLARVPIVLHPVWVDDERFDLERHVRLALAPPPGDRESLARMVGRILSDDLGLEHPPWQIWIVDGLEDGAVALVAKVHHCLVDGVSGVHLLERILRPYPDDAPAERSSWSSEPAPAGRLLLERELRHRARGLAELRRAPRNGGGTTRALLDLLGQGLRAAADAGINPRRLRRDRLFAACDMELDAVKAVKNAFGVTVNDVALAVASGAIRSFLQGRGVDVEALRGFRAMVPVSTHPAGDQALSGSRVALLLVDLAIEEPAPRRRLERIHEETAALKRGGRYAEAGELLVSISDATSAYLLSSVLRLALWRRGFNVVITNIPGPPIALYLLGSRMTSFRPLVNLWPHQAVGIALASYHGTLSWGFQAEAESVPDVAELARRVPRALSELRERTGRPSFSARP